MIHDQFYTYFDVEKLVQDFELILNQYGIEIQRSSELERLCLNIIDIKEKHPKPNLRAPHEDIRPYFRELLGLQDLMSKVVRAKDHPRFCSIIPHLKKLNIANPLQNINTSVLNAENNKLSDGPMELDRNRGVLSEALRGSRYAASSWGSRAK